MLQVPSQFPFPGSYGFLQAVPDMPKVQPCRILQRMRDGRLLISLTDRPVSDPNWRARAGGNRRVEASEVHATEIEAMEATRPRTRKPGRRRTRSARK